MRKELHPSGDKRYKISVKTLQGSILTFNNVKEYSFEGPILKFKDVKTGAVKRFAISNCEIMEVIR